MDKITNGQKESDPFAEFRAKNIEDTLIATEVEKLRNTREQVIGEARERCTRLQSGKPHSVIFNHIGLYTLLYFLAISKCEEYEATLCNFQIWCQHMHQILNARLADDIAALDIPQEYKVTFATIIKAIKNVILFKDLKFAIKFGAFCAILPVHCVASFASPHFYF